jgi:hypothetical protein
MFRSSLTAINGFRMKHRQRGAPAADRIVDKMPAKFAYVGLIHLALPHARIVRACRDPVDTCLSCFGLLFADEQPHTCDLAGLGRIIYSSYPKPMRHWEEVLPEGVMLNERYEDVVDDIQGQARRLIAHGAVRSVLHSTRS